MDFLYVIVAGMMVPIQAALNAQLKNIFGHAALSVMVSLIVSSGLMALYIFALRITPSGAVDWQRAPWWAWLGGLCGAFLLVVTTNMANKLGSTALVACIIGGQVLCSLVLDQFGWLGFAQHSLNIGRVIGVALLSAGVYLILKF